MTVTPATAELAALGATVQLTATVLDQHGNAIPGAQVAWSSGRAAVAAVDTAGLVTAVGNGTATVTAMAGTVTGTAEVTVAGVLQPDRSALVALFEATGGPQWNISDNWLTDAPVGEWHGVGIDGSGRVERLLLRFNSLSGPIPPELGHLERLRQLDLQFNALSGPVPKEIGDLAMLDTLVLTANELTGSLPSDLLRLDGLRRLSFANNAGLCAPGVVEWVEWLEGVNASGPYCNASDRATLVALFEATGEARWTNAEGWTESAGLDAWWGVSVDSLGRVVTLDLSRNGLTGRLPKDLGDLSRMTRLRVGGNGLSGWLPRSLAGLSLLELDYADTGICVLQEAAFLDWLHAIPSHNGSGAQCSDGDFLTALYEATGGPNWIRNDNWLSDAPLGDWHGVETDASGRVVGLDFSEHDPRWWWTCVGNNLVGVIPADIGNLTALEHLALCDNNLTGLIPPEIGNLTALRWLSLHGNELSGPIPPEIGNLTAL
ncbi:MAG: Ig-like domain-containing protein, partial [Acidobacteriota bacterium]|nr:Ig-like domain-containing protein [Acidobacteriota bacterium]